MGMGPGGMGMGPGGSMGPMGYEMMQGRQGPGYTMRSMVSNLDPFSAQTAAFSRIFKDNMVAGDIKFVAVNTDSVSNRQAVVDKLIANPWPWAQVMAKSANSGFTGFADMKVDIKKPTLVIADKGGVIKYAGPAAGFLAPLVAEQVAGNPSKPVVSVGNMLTEVRTARLTPKATQPSRLVQDDTEKLMVDVQAGKLLENAKMLIKSGSKLGSPRRGVEMCRRIIKEYPNTTYADEARKLLRGLNQRFQDRYKVTDEEMGL